MWQNVKVGNLCKGHMGILYTTGSFLRSEISLNKKIFKSLH